MGEKSEEIELNIHTANSSKSRYFPLNVKLSFEINRVLMLEIYGRKALSNSISWSCLFIFATPLDNTDENMVMP